MTKKQLRPMMIYGVLLATLVVVTVGVCSHPAKAAGLTGEEPLLEEETFLYFPTAMLDTGPSPPRTGTIHGSITHNGLIRDYILYLPANYSGQQPVPLLFNYHAYTRSAQSQMAMGDFRPIADREGFMIVHPQGSLLNGASHWNVGGWTATSTTDDVAFTHALLEVLSRYYNIDLTRVYSTGFSLGGYMSILLACQLSEEFAAVASVGGSMMTQTYNNCNSQRPVPLLLIHGTSDEFVPYNGDAWSMPINDVLDYWLTYNGCNPTAMTTALPDIDVNDGSTVEHLLYDPCQNDVTVQHLRVLGGNHTWPGTAAGGLGVNYDIDASTEIWNFVSQYYLNGQID